MTPTLEVAQNQPLTDAGPPSPSAPSNRPRKRSAGHIVAIVVGCLVLLPAFGMIAGGGAALVGQAVATDDDGYFRFTLDRIQSDGVAIATTDLWLDDVEGDASPWVFDWLDVDLRLRVQGAGATDEVFVGIARSADVERYLAEASYSEVVDVDGSRSRYLQVDGLRAVDPPVGQDFWTAQASGAGEQELTWNAWGGRWSVVVMNADGHADVTADVEVGARSGAVTPVAVTLLSIGGVLLVGAVVLIVIGVRGRRTTETPEVLPSAPASASASASAPASAPASATLPPPSIDEVRPNVDR